MTQRQEWLGSEALVANLHRLALYSHDAPLSVCRTPLGRWVISIGEQRLSEAGDLEQAVVVAVQYAESRLI